jgi:hypothetical protein
MVPLALPVAATTVVVMAVVVMAAVPAGHAEEEAAEEDGSDDEDASRHDADPGGDGAEPTVTAFRHHGYVFGRHGGGVCFSGRCGRLDGPGLRFGRRCFAHDSMMRGALRRG